MTRVAYSVYVIEHDTEVAKTEPGTRDGGGQTVGDSFFRDVPKLGWCFRRRGNRYLVRID